MGAKSRQTIVLIEPDKLLATTYQAALNQVGFSCVWQSNAQEAIQSIDQSQPTLIILEVQLPTHNGVELLYELQSYPDLQEIPVVILSYIPERELGLTASIKRQLGIVSYLYKPTTSLDQLIAATSNVMGSKS